MEKVLYFLLVASHPPIHARITWLREIKRLQDLEKRKEAMRLRGLQKGWLRKVFYDIGDGINQLGEGIKDSSKSGWMGLRSVANFDMCICDLVFNSSFINFLTCR